MYENTIEQDIKNIQTIYISAHINPDGDAVGSVMGLAFALEKLGKTPVILLEHFGEEFNILNGNKFIYNGDYSELNPEIMFAVDCGDKERLGEAGSVFDRAKLTYNIDHHISNNLFGDKNIVNGKASSACEVVYELISQFVDIDLNIATALYTGILTDTGCFMHNCTSKRTHQVAGELVGVGVDTPFIHQKILKEKTIERMKIEARAVSNMNYSDGIAYTYITAKDLEDCGASLDQIGGIVGYMLSIKGSQVSVFASERDNGIVKLSFRSKSVDVNKIASEYGGGGHVLAAGASVEGNLKDVLEKAVERVKRELDEK